MVANKTDWEDKEKGQVLGECEAQNGSGTKEECPPLLLQLEFLATCLGWLLILSHFPPTVTKKILADHVTKKWWPPCPPHVLNLSSPPRH